MKFNVVQWNSDAMGNESSMGVQWEFNESSMRVQSLAKAGTRGSSMSLGCNACGLSLLIARGAVYLHSVCTQWAMRIQWNSMEFNGVQLEFNWNSSDLRFPISALPFPVSGFPFQNCPYPISDLRFHALRFPIKTLATAFFDHGFYFITKLDIINQSF